MRYYITVDGGTTNTRVSLVKDGKITDTLKIKSEEDLSLYKAQLKKKIEELLRRSSITESDIIRILATGTMATAEIGLCPLEHLTLPVNIGRLKRESYETEIPEISKVPFVFVRGVKTVCDSVYSADMMRGEESELVGIMNGCREDSVYALMGSHTKIIKTDREGNILDIRTMLTGELAEAVSKNTILKHTVSLSFSSLDGEYLKRGCEYCLKRSINEALFKVRILKNIFGESDFKVYSFFLGAILFAEVKYLMESKPERIVIGGNERLKEALAILASEFTKTKVSVLPLQTVDACVSEGLVKIFEYGT